MEERGEQEYVPEKKLSEQRREPTTNSNPVYQNGVDDGIWTCMGHIGRRQLALSPLRHPLLPMLPPSCNENSNSQVNKKNIFTSSEFQDLSKLLIALTRNLFPWVSSHNITCKESKNIYYTSTVWIIYIKKLSYPQKQSMRWFFHFDKYLTRASFILVWFERSLTLAQVRWQANYKVALDN